ncbi:MAG: GIY-YIG nuclease family protein [Candidatus Omnitrophota bacterium]|jgi:putative endonuclease|nr:MAG: GIY-YIG nuclease family protein [Candidatus Omnitrophota bacterium]
MYFVYVLLSKKDGLFYTGFTNNLIRRVLEHNQGLQVSTKYRLPVELVYYEWCLDKSDAIDREKYLKSGAGKRYIRNRLKHHFTRN